MLSRQQQVWLYKIENRTSIKHCTERKEVWRACLQTNNSTSGYTKLKIGHLSNTAQNEMKFDGHARRHVHSHVRLSNSPLKPLPGDFKSPKCTLMQYLQLCNYYGVSCGFVLLARWLKIWKWVLSFTEEVNRHAFLCFKLVLALLFWDINSQWRHVPFHEFSLCYCAFRFRCGAMDLIVIL
jgi:hypothetical protein